MKEEVMEELPAMMQRRTRSDTGHSMDNFLYYSYSMIDPRDRVGEFTGTKMA